MSKAKDLIRKHGRDNVNEILSSGEDNDCMVRAVQHAFKVDYVDAHHFCETKLLRESRKGTFTGRHLPKIYRAFGKGIRPMGKKIHGTYYIFKRDQRTKVKTWSNAKQKYYMKKATKKVDYKVRDFIKTFGEGSFIVTVARHAFAVVDGTIIGNFDDKDRLNRAVHSAYKVS